MVEKYTINNYDLILMDVQMPEMNGLEATTIIREMEKGTSKHIPIIAVTAFAMAGDKDKYLSAGMDDYLAKPFRIEGLYNIIEQFLRK